jgi:hypothetical protein
METREAFAVVEEYEAAPNTCCAALPSYQSHKQVWALKIKEIHFDRNRRGENEETDGTAIIVPEEGGYAPIRVSAEYVNKHNPQVGGYWVQYQDGYQSWSPAELFESGYTAYKPSDNPHGRYAGIGWAVKHMQNGMSVRRAGWNGKGMFVFLVRDAWRGVCQGMPPMSQDLARSPFVAIKTADNQLVPWTASQADLLAVDWEIAE